MQKISVEVFEEPGRPEGGHAVVRLRGLASIPDDLTFRIKPVDSIHHSDLRGGWAEGELRPIATRMTEHGAELVVGPEVVENPLFLPGTLTVIEIQKCGVRGEFLWPRISPLVRPKRRHLRLAKPLREQPAEVAAPIAFEEAPDASAGVHAVILPPEPVAISITPGAGAAVMAAAGVSNRPLTTTADPTSGAAAAERSAAVTGLAGEPGSRAAGSSDPFAALRDAADGATDVVWSKRRDARRFGPAHLTGAALVGGVLAALLAGMTGDRHAAPATPMANAHETALVGGTVAKSADPVATLADLLQAGSTSPRGRDVARAAPLDLLEAADGYLHGPAQSRDAQEAAFLLRRYLAGTLSEDRTLWALTQLGSSYAQTGGAQAPDYGRARQLWQIAGALGDPVAMCFLGALHEHGLGTAADRDAALRWYVQAKQANGTANGAGGCADVDDAIARVKK